MRVRLGIRFSRVLAKRFGEELNLSSYRMFRRFWFGALLTLSVLLGTVDVTEAQVSPMVSAGSGHNVFLRSTGTVLTLGANSSGQLGIGSTDDSYVPVGASLSAATRVAAGGSHTLALMADGTVWAWGGNLDGQLGNNTYTSSSVPLQVSTLTNIVAIAAGAAHSLAVRNDGVVFAWGFNGDGRLGDGSWTSSPIPVQVSGLTGVISVAAGESHSLALTSSGNVYGWGLNNNGQLGLGTTTTTNVPTQATGISNVTKLAAGGAHSLAADSNGNVWAWGQNTFGQLGDGTLVRKTSPTQILSLSGMADVAAGRIHSIAISSSGAVFSWGTNSAGQLGDGTTTRRTSPVQIMGGEGSNVVAIAAGFDHSLALRSDGNVLAWGSNSAGQTGRNPTLLSVVPDHIVGFGVVEVIDAGDRQTLVITQERRIYAWGDNANGQLGNAAGPVATPVGGPNLENVVAISTGGSLSGRHSLAVVSGGAVWAWGANSNGQLGNDSLVQSTVPVPSGSLTNITNVAAGGGHSLALHSDGTVWAWGVNANGQLGIGSTTRSQIPVQIPTLSGVIAIAAGSAHSLALKNDGTVWAWGLNGNGQAGLGTTIVQSTVPVPVGGIGGVAAIAAGNSFTLALKANGEVWAWGFNSQGQIGDGTTNQANVPQQVPGLAGIAQIGIGGAHSFAITSQGLVFAWGSNTSGQLGTGTTVNSLSPTQVAGLDHILSIQGGEFFTVALREDGTLLSFGDSPNGQRGTGEMAFYTTPLDVLGANLQYDTPAANIGSPPNGTTTPIGSIVNIELVHNSEENIASVELHHRGTTIGSAAAPPLSIEWIPQTWGDWRFSAVSVDINGSKSHRSPEITIPVPYDSEPDGLPDWWEYRYFGTLSEIPATDPDQDGISNLVEYQNKTNPTDFYNGVLPTLTITGGNQQSGPLGTWLPLPLGVSVTSGGSSLVNAPIEFAAVLGDPALALSTNDPNLQYTMVVNTLSGGVTPDVFVLLPNTAGQVTVEARATTNGQTAKVTFTLQVAANAIVFNPPGGRYLTSQVVNLSIDYPGAVIHYTVDGSEPTTSSPAVSPGGNGNVQLAYSARLKARAFLSGDPVGAVQSAVYLIGPLVAAANDTCFAIGLDGTGYSWGRSSLGQLGGGGRQAQFSPASFGSGRAFAAISGGVEFALAVQRDNVVAGWGDGYFGQLGLGSHADQLAPASISGTSFAKIAAGTSHALGLTNAGQVWTWGDGSAGQLGNNSFTGRNSPGLVPGATVYTQIAAGKSFSLAVDNAGGLWGWGANDFGQLGSSNGIRVSTPAALTVPLGQTIKAIAAGASHALLLTQSGQVFAWGANGNGQLGDGTTNPAQSPQLVAGLTGIIAIRAGQYHSIALSQTGVLYVWGANWSGQVGNSYYTDQLTPIAVPGLGAPVVDAAAGLNHSVAILNNGKVFTFGDNRYGQLGVAAITGSASPVEVQDFELFEP
jgi:alpha-tubulin suppressor-like RCC1 family protein